MQILRPEDRKKRRLAYWLVMGGGGPRGLISNGILSAPLTLTRPQAAGVEATGLTAAGWQTYGADTPRFVLPGSGLLIEGQRTNLLTTARAPATETVTVTAAAHTLSFLGTGSIALSGAATGTLAGTGAANRVTLTFTPSAGSLTLTVSGSVSLPQLELGAFASTPILPPVGAPGASARGTDIVTAPLSSLGIGSNGACTVLWRGVIPQAAQAGASQTIFQMEGVNGDGDRFAVRNPSNTSNVVPFRVTAGVIADSAATAFTPGVAFRWGMTIRGDGTAAFSFNGGAAIAVLGGPTAGFTTFRLGTTATGTNAIFGTTERLQVLPRVVSDADLAALVAAF